MSDPVDPHDGPMAPKLSEAERAEIITLIESGKSCNDVAKTVGRSSDTVSRIAREIGWTFGRTNLASAREARSAYSAEKRAEIAASMTEHAERILRQLVEPHTAFNFGGKDNDYNERTFDLPPADAAFTIARTARELVRTVLDIDRHDNRGDTVGSAFDAFLEHMMGGGE